MGSEILLDILAEKRRVNPLFSMRAFARFLGVSPAQVSQVLSGKRPISKKFAHRIAEKLMLSPQERIALLKSLNPDLVDSNEQSRQTAHQVMTEEQFEVISEWYHFAILSLGSLKSNQAKSKWIARRLGISELEALDAYQRLKRLGLIEERAGRFRQSALPLRTTAEVSSAALRKYHKQNLNLAAQRLEQVAVDAREYTSITMAINPRYLKRAKEMITDFKRSLAKELERGELTEVYTLAVQLFPVTDLRRKDVD